LWSATAQPDYRDYWLLNDLIVEAQKNLLSGLFEGKVPLRQPLDPRFKVISTDSDKEIEELLRYFTHDTAWGKNNALTRETVKEQLRSDAQQGSARAPRT
jgi:hypothetical protein